MDPAMPDLPPIPAPLSEAQRLMELWSHLERNHVPLVVGCSCGGPVNHLRLRDIEQDILDYLYDKYCRPETTKVCKLLRDCAVPAPGANGSLAVLLGNLAARTGEHDKPARALLLADLDRSIASLAPLARPAH